MGIHASTVLELGTSKNLQKIYNTFSVIEEVSGFNEIFNKQ